MQESEQTVSGDERLVSGPFCRVSWHPINLNSSQQVKDYLLSVGWQPTEWNYREDKNGRPVYNLDGEKIKTSPKLTEDSFDSVQGDIPSLVARRNILVHRQRMLKNTRKDGAESGLLNRLRSDGRIEARAIPQSTNTGRATHSIVVNIPAVGAVYGEEIRNLFITKDPYVMLGIDAQALEARCLGHYLLNYPGGDALVDVLLHGDIHEENAQLWGCSRKAAKSPFYALLFGAQAPKLAQTMGVDLATATQHYDNFWSHYQPLASFKGDLIKAWKARGGKKGGYLRGLDGRKLFARSEHSLVNLMIQATGSVAVKTALVLTDRKIKEYHLDAHQIIFMHDEAEYEVHKDHVGILKPVAESCFISAGKKIKLNVPLVGEAKVGSSWGEVH